MVLVLATLGVGPAWFMRPTLGWTIRLFLSPAFGLAAGITLFTTLIWFFPAGRTDWLIPLLGLASCGVALWRASATRNPGAIESQPTAKDPPYVVEPMGRPRSTRFVIAGLQVAAVSGPCSCTDDKHNCLPPQRRPCGLSNRRRRRLRGRDRQCNTSRCMRWK